MFRKPAALKPSTPLRSSARRAFVAHLQALYPVLAVVPPEVLQQVVPTGLKQCSATTSGNQKAVIYTDEHGVPLWFELGDNAGAALQQAQKKPDKNGQSSQAQRLAEVIPTVYTLWFVPSLLPRLPTWPQIVDPTLLGGSALMIPGLIPPPNSFPEALNGGPSRPPASSLIAITAYPSPVPLVVARLEMNMEDLCRKRAMGEKGKAATPIHTKGDHLWEMGGKKSAPSDGEVEKRSQCIQVGADGGDADIGERIEALAIADAAGGQDGQDDGESGGSQENGSLHRTDGGSDTTFGTSEVDAIMHLALLQSLAKLAATPAQLPIPLSQLYSSLVLPNRPAHWPPRDAKGRGRSRVASHLVTIEGSGDEKTVLGEATDIKRTSAKKLSKWIKAAEKSELLKCKEGKGKDTLVTSINSSHAELSSLSPYYTLAQAQLDSANATPIAESPAATPAGKTAVVIERFWKASASSVKLFQEMGASTSEPLSQPVIRAHLYDYIAQHGLVDGHNQAQIRLEDPALVHALYPKVALSDIPASLTRQELLDRLLATSCIEYHRSSRLSPARAREVQRENSKGKPASGDKAETAGPATNGGDEFVGPMTKGAAKPVTVDIKTRQGRKVISLITGLEVYGMDPHSLAQELMKQGASASATALPSSTPKNPKHEVFVQGDQRKAIYDFVESRGLERHFVHLHDGTKK